MTKRFKKGAASFYIVAFSTLILVVIAMSFAAVVISEITRTSNDDLAQSAYDSALAGVEDAKLAYYNYQSCVEQGVKANDSRVSESGDITCQDIVNWVEKPDEGVKNMKSCDMVGHIIGRIGKGEDGTDTGGVMIQETREGDNAMQQAYTCVKLNPILNNVKINLSEGNTTRVLQVKLDDTPLADINTIKVSWGAVKDEKFNYSLLKDSGVVFPLLGSGEGAINVAPNPPLLSVGIVQTTDTFKLSDFDYVTESTTDRGTVYLVPSNDEGLSTSTNWDNAVGAWDGEKNVIKAGDIVKSNDRAVKNIPFKIYCNGESTATYDCSANLNLPGPYDSTGEGSKRSDDTFMLVISSPYGIATDVQIEFCASTCNPPTNESVGGDDTDIKSTRHMQIGIDSTGRANDLYRRVEARIESGDAYYPYPQFGVELLDESGGAESLLVKPLVVTAEHSSIDYADKLEELKARR